MRNDETAPRNASVTRSPRKEATGGAMLSRGTGQMWSQGKFKIVITNLGQGHGSDTER
jgi:hypothetical protein